MTRTLLALAAVLAASVVSAQTVAPSPPPNAPTTPPAAPPGSGMAPQPRYEDVVHPYELRPGDRIRVWDKAGTLEREDGTVVGADQNGIAATLDGRVRLLRYAELEHLQMRRGKGHAKVGAFIGFGVGCVLYALRDADTERPGVDFLALTVPFTGLGALAGNYAWRPDWRPVDFAAQPTGPQSPELRPQSRLEPAGLPGVQVAIRF